MASVDVIVRSTDQGSRNIQSFGQKLDGLTSTALKVGASLGVAGLAFKALEGAARAAWQTLSEGAALDLANSKFENLAASIGTTAEALKGQMGEATQGMMTNAQMVSAASDMISLGMANTGDEVVRLSNLVGRLGWDMNVLTLTMANDSMLRLDALGLSMADVKERMEEFKAAGMEMSEAFDLAVIEAGEAKVALLGNTAETAAGKMQIAENAITNYTDALKIQAVQIAENIGLLDALAVKAERMNLGMDLRDLVNEARDLGVISRNQTGYFDNIIRYGGVDDLEAAIAQLDYKILQNSVTWQGWAVATVMALNETKDAAIAASTEIFRAMTVGNNTDWFGGFQGEDWLPLALPRKLGKMMGDGIRDEMDASLKGWGSSLLYPEDVEAAKQAADEIAAVYEEAAVRMGQAFAGALEPGAMPDFGNVGAMKDDAWEMAKAFGLSVEQAGNFGIALGEITPEMAEMAAKAAIFQEAFNNLLGQFKAGNIDATELTTAFDNLIADLNSKSLVEIQVELKTKAAGPTGPQFSALDFLPEEDRAAIASGTGIEVPVTFTPEEAALNQALGVIDGIPDNQDKIITFDAKYEEVETAITTIEGDIAAIDATVLMTPETEAVDTYIQLVDESRLTVYVDFVQGSSPELPGKAAGGPVWGGEAYVIGERGPEVFVPWTSGTVVPNERIGGGGVTVSLQNYFYGPTDAAEVARATDTAARRMMERLQQVMSV